MDTEMIIGIIGIVAVGVGLYFAFGQTVSPQKLNPAISITPNPMNPEFTSSITMSGKGFAPNSSIAITANNQLLAVAPETDANGNFTNTWTYPGFGLFDDLISSTFLNATLNSTANINMTATDTSLNSASVSLSITATVAGTQITPTPSISLKPNSISGWNDYFAIYGNNFTPNSAIKVSVDNYPIALYATTDVTGKFSLGSTGTLSAALSWIIPTMSAGRTLTITITDAAGKAASANLTIG